MPELDLITVGRVNLDLYAQQTGLPFGGVLGWDAMIGGSPTNVALAITRLGRSAAPFTAVGEDPVGDWILEALAREGVQTQFVSRKRGPHTSLALRAQNAPEHTLAFYRHDPADIHLSAAEASAIPVDGPAALLVSADALARGSTADVCRALAVARTGRRDHPTYLDLDLRPSNWPDLQTYARTVMPLLEDVGVVLGNEAEYAALLGLSERDPALVDRVRDRLGGAAGHTFIVKHGDRGATVLTGAALHAVPAFEVVEASSVGAGDSFAAGLIDARLAGAEWPAATRFASACAAITASRFGCSVGFPHRHEVAAFLEARPAQSQVPV